MSYSLEVISALLIACQLALQLQFIMTAVSFQANAFVPSMWKVWWLMLNDKQNENILPLGPSFLHQAYCTLQYNANIIPTFKLFGNMTFIPT